MDPISKYRNYDFLTDENWNVYVSNFFPAPTRNQLEKIKRKWYHNNIDSSFDPKFDENPKEDSFSDPQPQDKEKFQEPSSKEEEKKPEAKPKETQQPPNKEEKKPEDKPNVKEPSAKEEAKEEKTSSQHQHHAGCSHSHATQPEAPKTISNLTNILFAVEGFLKFFFLLSIILATDTATWVSLAICVLALIRQCKRPRWNKEYAEKLVYNEYFHNIWFMIPFILFPRQQSIFYFAPLAIHSWIGLCEYINLKSERLKKLLRGAVEKTRERRIYLMSMKQKLEILLLINLIIMIFLAQSNLLIVILYSNYLRIKYVVNRNLTVAFYEIDLWIRSNVVKENSPRVVKWIYNKFCGLCKYMVTPTNLKKNEDKKEETKTN